MENNPDFTADAYLLNSADPSGSGTGFYYMGPAIRTPTPSSSVPPIFPTERPAAASPPTRSLRYPIPLPVTR